MVIFRHGPAVATLLGELETSAMPTIVVEEDEAEARRLQGRKHHVIHGILDEGTANTSQPASSARRTS